MSLSGTRNVVGFAVSWLPVSILPSPGSRTIAGHVMSVELLPVRWELVLKSARAVPQGPIVSLSSSVALGYQRWTNTQRCLALHSNISPSLYSSSETHQGTLTLAAIIDFPISYIQALLQYGWLV